MHSDLKGPGYCTPRSRDPRPLERTESFNNSDPGLTGVITGARSQRLMIGEDVFLLLQRNTTFPVVTACAIQHLPFNSNLSQ